MKRLLCIFQAHKWSPRFFVSWIGNRPDSILWRCENCKEESLIMYEDPKAHLDEKGLKINSHQRTTK